jgi:predicted RNase H-like nuclease (RuvC/YqgF family)
METNLIAIKTLCTHYEIEFSFIHDLHQTGLVQIVTVEQEEFIHKDEISELEKMIRLYHDLNINIEGIDVIFNLLEKEKKLLEEITVLKNKLRLYEKD